LLKGFSFGVFFLQVSAGLRQLLLGLGFVITGHLGGALKVEELNFVLVLPLFKLDLLSLGLIQRLSEPLVVTPHLLHLAL